MTYTIRSYEICGIHSLLAVGRSEVNYFLLIRLNIVSFINKYYLIVCYKEYCKSCIQSLRIFGYFIFMTIALEDMLLLHSKC
jgi:hypothetical protein